MARSKKVLCVIPARYDSSRFPGKPLVCILNKPMIQWVYERVSQTRDAVDVLVATDDIRIYKAVQNFGGNVVMTSRYHSTGTLRVIQAARAFEADIVVNVQGDEPFIEPSVIQATVKALQKNLDVPVSTAASPLLNSDDLENPNVVKVVLNKKGEALYFSRSCIPYMDQKNFKNKKNASVVLKHIGIYAYRKSFLEKLARLSPTPLEQIERLEQLRILEHGYKMGVAEVVYDGMAVDTPSDLAKIKRFLTKKKNAF